jgi:uncharacterized protein
MKTGQLDHHVIEEIALGATVLGTGGGGDPLVGKLIAQQAVAEYGPVELVPLEDVPDEGWLIPTAMMGAPTVLIEKIPSGKEASDAFKILEERVGGRAFATLSIEAGGVNSMIPIVVAARLGIPMIDADGMSRAFPELQMVAPTLYGVRATPMGLADEKGNRMVIETPDNHWTERIARAVTVRMGGSSHVALYAMQGSVAKEALIPGTISLEREIGRTLLECRRDKHDPVQALLDLLGAHKLAHAKITDVHRRTERGFTVGVVDLIGMQGDTGSRFRIQFQNENLVIWKDEKPQATVPDLITVLDEQTGTAITTESLKYGLRVVVIGIPCHEKWRQPAAIELVGPRYFGYDTEYVPLQTVGR